MAGCGYFSQSGGGSGALSGPSGRCSILPGVQRVYLEDFADRPAATPGLQLVQLLVAEPANAIVQARTLLTTAVTQPDATASWSFHDLIETILVYKLPQLTREEIQAMLHLPDIDLKQTRFYQQAVAEGGQREAAALVLRLLRRRLGALEVEQEARIQTLSVLELEALAEALLEFKTADELTAWRRHPGSGRRRRGWHLPRGLHREVQGSDVRPALLLEEEQEWDRQTEGGHRDHSHPAEGGRGDREKDKRW